MYYIALFVFLSVSTFFGWLLVNKLVEDTDQLSSTFEARPAGNGHLTDPLVIDGLEVQPAETTIVSESVAQTVVIDDDLNPIAFNTDVEGENSESEAKVILVEEIIPEELKDEPEVVQESAEDKEITSFNGELSEEEGSLRADSDGDSGDEDDEITLAINEPQVNQAEANQVELESKKRQKELEKNSVRALDLAYAVPDVSRCEMQDNRYPRIGVFYRTTSASIKGESLTNIDKLIKLHGLCGGGKLILLKNGLKDEAESNERLRQRRQDEVKYYLIQRRVPKEDIIFPDNL